MKIILHLFPFEMPPKIYKHKRYNYLYIYIFFILQQNGNLMKVFTTLQRNKKQYIAFMSLLYKMQIQCYPPYELKDGEIVNSKTNEKIQTICDSLESETKESDNSYMITKSTKQPYLLIGFYSSEDVEFDFCLDEIKFRYHLKANKLFYALIDTYYLPYNTVRSVCEYRIKNFSSTNIKIVKQEVTKNDGRLMELMTHLYNIPDYTLVIKHVTEIYLSEEKPYGDHDRDRDQPGLLVMPTKLPRLLITSMK